MLNIYQLLFHEMKIIRLTYFDVTIFLGIVLDPFREDDWMIYFINNHNLSNDVNGSLESSDLFFFQTKINARGCFEEDLVYPFAFPLPPVLLFTVYSPSPPSILPKVISAGNLSLWRESRRHFLVNETKRARRRRSRSSKNN